MRLFSKGLYVGDVGSFENQDFDQPLIKPSLDEKLVKLIDSGNPLKYCAGIVAISLRMYVDAPTIVEKRESVQ